ncbi:MAG TPA: polysaccharide biosynthesis/export family protein [bacterium]|nr:polysaccharide biosynthesis/export family protein [bacterium]
MGKWSLPAVLLAFALGMGQARALEPETVSSPAAASTPSARATVAPPEATGHANSDYRVGPHDLIEVRVQGEEDLSRTTEVTSKGVIEMPLVGTVPVAGLTIAEVEDRLKALYGKDYLVHPEIFVNVKEFRSQSVQVLGAVKSPGVITLQRPSTVLDLIATAGGISDAGGKTLLLLRGQSAPDAKGAEPITIDVHRLLVEGDTSQNLDVRGGDIVFVPRGDEVFVLGEVKNPGSLKYEEGMTLTQAISKVSGFTRTAAKRRVQIVRVDDTGKKTQIDVNVGRIEAGKDEDLKLKARDLVVVPESIF